MALVFIRMKIFLKLQALPDPRVHGKSWPGLPPNLRSVILQGILKPPGLLLEQPQTLITSPIFWVGRLCKMVGISSPLLTSNQLMPLNIMSISPKAQIAFGTRHFPLQQLLSQAVILLCILLPVGEQLKLKAPTLC